MIGQPQMALNSLNQYYQKSVTNRNDDITKTIINVCSMAHSILKDVEAVEQRFSSTLVQDQETGRFLGVSMYCTVSNGS